MFAGLFVRVSIADAFDKATKLRVAKTTLFRPILEISLKQFNKEDTAARDKLEKPSATSCYLFISNMTRVSADQYQGSCSSPSCNESTDRLSVGTFDTDIIEYKCSTV